MTQEGLARLRAHVNSLVAAARPPASEVSGLVEEMLGHLEETVEGGLAMGTDEDEAIRSAIAVFGSPEIVGRELARTYHSKLWASTIGVLLAPPSGDRTRPGPIGGLRLIVAAMFGLTILAGSVAVVNLSPLFALVAGTAFAAFLVGAVLVFRGLGLGQRWAMYAGLGLAGLAVAAGLAEVASAPAGTTTIPILAIAAGLILVWAALDSVRIEVYNSGSRPIGAALGLAVAGALLAPTIVSPVLSAVHDPTQIVASDVVMTISMRCHVGLDRPTGDPRVDTGPEAMLAAELSWSRWDVLPGGLAGLIGTRAANDTAGFRVIDPPPTPMENGGGFPTWLLSDGQPVVIDPATGEAVGWFGASSPSLETLPDMLGSLTVEIDNARIRPGHTTRIEWSLIPVQDGPPAWPRVEVGYAHLDRFVLFGRVGCGEHAIATADTVPAPSQARFLP